MQNRQLIRDQFGLLEEQLEELHAVALDRATNPDTLIQDALVSLRELSRLVHDQQHLKSVPSSEFLLRICTLLVQEAAANGTEVSVSHFSEGRISMEVAELILSSIVSAFRTSLKGLSSNSRAERLERHLFPTGSIYLEMRTGQTEIQFRLVDDGVGHSHSLSKLGSFAKLREHIAKCGGWFGSRDLSPYGGMIEFKIPLVRNRVEAVILRNGDFEVLVPSTCIAESLPAGQNPPPGSTVFNLNEAEGLIAAADGSSIHIRIGIADQEFWIGCESIGGPVKTRKLPCAAFVEEGCWMRSMGVFSTNGFMRALPILDGPAMLRGRDSEGGTE